MRSVVCRGRAVLPCLYAVTLPYRHLSCRRAAVVTMALSCQMSDLGSLCGYVVACRVAQCCAVPRVLTRTRAAAATVPRCRTYATAATVPPCHAVALMPLLSAATVPYRG